MGKPGEIVNQEISQWLKGQVDAINKLVDAVACVLDHHSTLASAELRKAKYPCNAAIVQIEEQTKQEQKGGA